MVHTCTHPRDDADTNRFFQPGASLFLVVVVCSMGYDSHSGSIDRPTD